jgi:hypothetical protein
VSPQNLLVGTDGITRIADFGIAKAAGRTQTTRDGAVKGKLTYMSPEQLGTGVVTRTTDVFAAAVVLWELLTGQRLFEGVTQAESVFKVLNAPIVPPSQLVGDVGPDLDAIVMRGLARDPAERFATARDMAQALEACAPPVRPAEIAAWVERIGGDSLARRARLMALIEHAPDGARRSDDSGSSAEQLLTPSRQPTVYSGPSLGAMDARTQFLEGSGTYARSLRAGATAPKRTRYGLIALALLLVTAAVAMVLFVVSQKPHDGAAQLPAPLESTPAAARVTAPTTTPVIANTPADPKTAASPQEILPQDEQDEQADEPRDPDPRRPKKAAARRKAARDARDKNEAREPAERRVNCDPPYSIDESGRRIFKTECL